MGGWLGHGGRGSRRWVKTGTCARGASWKNAPTVAQGLLQVRGRAEGLTAVQGCFKMRAGRGSHRCAGLLKVVQKGHRKFSNGRRASPQLGCAFPPSWACRPPPTPPHVSSALFPPLLPCSLPDSPPSRSLHFHFPAVDCALGCNTASPDLPAPAPSCPHGRCGPPGHLLAACCWSARCQTQAPAWRSGRCVKRWRLNVRCEV
eukprot:210018-Chlamydomonas_euryale.AAC.1